MELEHGGTSHSMFNMSKCTPIESNWFAFSFCKHIDQGVTNNAQTLYWILGITDPVYHQLFKEYIKSHIYMLIQLTLFQQHFGS